MNTLIPLITVFMMGFVIAYLISCLPRDIAFPSLLDFLSWPQEKARLLAKHQAQLASFESKLDELMGKMENSREEGIRLVNLCEQVSVQHGVYHQELEALRARESVRQEELDALRRQTEQDQKRIASLTARLLEERARQLFTQKALGPFVGVQLQASYEKQDNGPFLAQAAVELKLSSGDSQENPGPTPTEPNGRDSFEDHQCSGR